MKNTVYCSGIRVNEISIRYNRPKKRKLPKIKDVEDAISTFKQCFENDRIGFKEFFFAMYLNGSSQVLAISLVGEGTERAVLISSQEIVSSALLLNARGVIIAHNHPHDNATFSVNDKKTSTQLMGALNLFGINFIDHLVFTKNEAISLFQEHEELF